MQEEVKGYVEHIFKYLPASDRQLAQIKEHQDMDPIIKKWKSQVTKGERRTKCTQYHNDLSVKDGLLMKDNRIVIPQDLRLEVLQQLHTDHHGLVKCKERARTSVWWPEIMRNIESFVRRCRVCCQFQRPRFEPLCCSASCQICLGRMTYFYGNRQIIYW